MEWKKVKLQQLILNHYILDRCRGRWNYIILPVYKQIIAKPEDFVERDINWMRLRDLTIGYTIPTKLLSKQNAIKEASVFINGTDLFLLTNYSGADPYVSTTNPATGGAGGFGMDFGKTSLPRTFSMGLNVTF